VLEIADGLRAEIEAAEAVRPQSEFYIGLGRAPNWQELSEQYIENLIATAFLGWRAEAGLPSSCTMLGLRAAGATRLAAMGATAHMIMGWGGWTSLDQVEVYTKHFDTRRLGEDAVRLFNAPTVGVVPFRRKVA